MKHYDKTLIMQKSILNSLPKQNILTLPQRHPKPLDYYLLLLFGDIFSFLLSFSFAIIFRYLIGLIFPFLPPFGLPKILQVISHVWLFFPIFLSLLLRRVYDRRLPFWEETKEIIAAIFWGIIATFAFISIEKLSDQTSRMVVGFTGIFLVFFIPFVRYYWKPFLFRFKRYNFNALIIGVNSIAKSLSDALKSESYLGYNLVGFLDDNTKFYGCYFNGLKIFGSVKQIGKFVRLAQVEAVFITGNCFSPSRLSEIYAICQRLVKEIYIVPEFFGLGMLNAELSCLFSQRVFVLRIRNNLLLSVNRYFKRCVDLFLTLLLLPFVLPIMLIVAILIKLDSPGPVFFKQERVGEGGRKFYILKFRTMFLNSENLLKEYLEKNPQARKQWSIYRKLENDPRVTKIGYFLRKFSLDELPQFFNILKGDMALVGPRPVTPEELKNYGDKLNFYLAVKPGLTGLWQVSGRNLLSYTERVQLDVWYVLNWSLWLDLIILARTVATVISQRGSF